ncbi:unnamed protein product [Rhodiola kirilowii]
MAISVHKPSSPDPSPSPSPSPVHSTSVPLLSAAAAAISSDTAVAASRSVSRIDFSPPLIAMVIVIASAFLIITYSRLISKHVTKPILNTFHHWRRRRRRRSHVASSAGDVESTFNHSNSNFFDPTDGYQIFSPGTVPGGAWGVPGPLLISEKKKPSLPFLCFTMAGGGSCFNSQQWL